MTMIARVKNLKIIRITEITRIRRIMDDNNNMSEGNDGKI